MSDEDEFNVGDETISQLNLSREEYRRLVAEVREEYDGDIVTKDDVLNEMQEILSTSYQKAKAVHINTEEKTGETNLVAITNFRDGLDHVSKIFDAINGENVDIDKAIENLAEMRAHIERTIFDGAQEVPEKYVDDIIQNRYPDIYYWLTGLDAPPNREWEEAKENIARELSSGRRFKATKWEDSLKHFRNAENIANEMRKRTPPKEEVRHRLWILGLSAGGLLIGIIAIVITLIFQGSG